MLLTEDFVDFSRTNVAYVYPTVESGWSALLEKVCARILISFTIRVGWISVFGPGLLLQHTPCVCYWSSIVCTEVGSKWPFYRMLPILSDRKLVTAGANICGSKRLRPLPLRLSCRQAANLAPSITWISPNFAVFNLLLLITHVCSVGVLLSSYRNVTYIGGDEGNKQGNR